MQWELNPIHRNHSIGLGLLSEVIWPKEFLKSLTFFYFRVTVKTQGALCSGKSRVFVRLSGSGAGSLS